MKRYYITFVLLSLFMAASAQSYGTKGVYTTNGSAVIVGQKAARDVYGGTVINPKFIGSGFNPTIRRAFKHACEIWEEQIPTTYPLNINVKIGTLVGNNTLAYVSPRYSSDFFGRERASLKRIAQWDSYWQLDAEDFINETDAEITFTSRNVFDFNTDSLQCNPNKYDFITVAIQAIGKALGFYLQAYYDGQYLCPFDSANVYTYYVYDRMGNMTYQNAINSGNMSIVKGNKSWPLYCPATYNSNFSLAYFAINATDDETVFMQPGISKGTVVRHVGESMQAVFSAMGWDRAYATGGGSTVINGTSTSNVIDYVGSRNNCYNTVPNRARSYNNDDYFYKCSEEQSQGNYVLLKDGSWQSYSTLSNLNPNDTCYARTTDGFLRLLQVTWSPGAGNYYNSIIQHRLYKFPPQKPVFEVNKYTLSDLNSIGSIMRGRSVPITSLTDEDEYIDVEIGFERTEGCNYILVEQTDSDWPVPFTYYVDISPGCFIAYMNKRYPSTFKLTYINDEGMAISSPKVIDLSNDSGNSSSIDLIIKPRNNHLQYEFIVPDNMVFGAYPYIINNLTNASIMESGCINTQIGNIDVSALPHGFYNINVSIGDTVVSAKWNK